MAPGQSTVAWNLLADASELAFMTWRDVDEQRDRPGQPNVEIHKINLANGKLTNLTRNSAWDAYPAWRRTTPLP